MGMKKTITTALMGLTLVFGAGSATLAVAQKGDNDRATECEKAGRERQIKEIDHATGKGSEKDMKDARDREAKACDRDKGKN
jgi:hypothetical protein